MVFFIAGCGDSTAGNDLTFPEFVYRSKESLNGYRIAAGGTTCLDEAMDLGQWQGEGLSVLAIRERIDTKYSERAEATDTPMPE
ncbi:MAG: PCYCGC motif-containing (lipo)protein [Thermoleophilia bacterium]